MTRTPTALACLFLGLPPAALAQSPAPPPSSAGVQQYLETVPDARGDRLLPRGDVLGAQTVSPAARRRLQAAGPEGRDLLAALERAGWGLPGDARPSARREAAAGSGDGEAAHAPGAILAALTEGDFGGMGWGLPAFMVGSLIALVAVGRRRRGE